jgi:hypothetical protein
MNHDALSRRAESVPSLAQQHISRLPGGSRKKLQALELARNLLH